LTQPTLVTEEVKSWIGKKSDWWTPPEPVERGAIRRFAEGIMDRNPLYTDEEYARKSRYGSLIAPPTYVIRPPYGGWEIIGPGERSFQIHIPGARRAVNAGNEVEIFRPVKVGDIVKQRSRVLNIYEREGRSGKMAIVVIETVYANQHNQVLAIGRQTYIRMP
jgi:acyl dehydratase